MLWVCFCLNTLEDNWCQRTIGRQLSRLPMSLYSVRWQPSDESFWRWSDLRHNIFVSRLVIINSIYWALRSGFWVQQMDRRVLRCLMNTWIMIITNVVQFGTLNFIMACCRGGPLAPTLSGLSWIPKKPCAKCGLKTWSRTQNESRVC